MAQESKATKRWCALIWIFAFSNGYITAASGSIGYQVFFMKKVWSTTVIGKDIKADTAFHFHQVTLYYKAYCILIIAERIVNNKIVI